MSTGPVASVVNPRSSSTAKSRAPSEKSMANSAAGESTVATSSTFRRPTRSLSVPERNTPATPAASYTVSEIPENQRLCPWSKRKVGR